MRVSSLVFIVLINLYAQIMFGDSQTWKNYAASSLVGLKAQARESLSRNPRYFGLAKTGFALHLDTKCQGTESKEQAKCLDLAAEKLASSVQRIVLRDNLALASVERVGKLSDVQALLGQSEFRALVRGYWAQTEKAPIYRDALAQLQKSESQSKDFFADIDQSQASGRQPSSVDSNRVIRIDSVMGPMKSVFTVEMTKTGPGIRYRNSSEMKFFRRISKEQFDYLVENAKGLKPTAVSIETCRGSHARVRYAGREVFGCLLTNDPDSDQVDRFVNLMSF